MDKELNAFCYEVVYKYQVLGYSFEEAKKKVLELMGEIAEEVKGGDIK